MDVFKLRDSIIKDYSRYISSFIEIFDSRIAETVNKEMNEGLLWPYPLIQLNPPFAISEDMNSLVDQNVLHKECRNIFRSGKDKTGTEVPRKIPRSCPEKFPENSGSHPIQSQHTIKRMTYKIRPQ
jgi:hypothetical protein